MAGSSDEGCVPGPSTKKRPKFGRMSEVIKKVKLRSHEIVPACNCVRFKCFEVLSEEQKRMIIKNFNELDSHDYQNSYLCGLITVVPVQQRRSRKNNNGETQFHDAAYSYRVRIQFDGSVQDFPVCAKAFMALHGIGRGKLEFLQKSLKLIGVSPKDKRGKKSHIHRKLSENIFNAIVQHIGTFQGRKSHYSLKKTRKLYLPEELNISKMFEMFKIKYPDIKVSYETYRNIFNTKFNISFGYPRIDTCSFCDEINVKLKALEVDTKKNESEIKNLTTQKRIHSLKAEAFYSRKKAARLRARKDSNFEAIAMDYQKNVSLPNITTNDVYYKRQLSMYNFNIHVLSSEQSFFYTYPETHAKKGADEVAAFLFHFITNYLYKSVKELSIFCDSAGGQNKNYTLIRFIHFVTCEIKLLNHITTTFPIRGHSYLECDKNMSLINLKTRMEMPADWMRLIESSRKKPCPFVVVEVDLIMIKSWTQFFAKNFVAQCPFKTQPVRILYAKQDKPGLIFHKSAYNGLSTSSVVKKKIHFARLSKNLAPGEFQLPLGALFRYLLKAFNQFR